MMVILSQVDIAPTIVKILSLQYRADGKQVEEIVDYGRGCRMVVLLIIDGLGYALFNELRQYLPNINRVSSVGKIYECEAVARYTTPAIASILCGKLPEEHEIYRTGDVYKSDVKSIAEAASEQGTKSAVVMEEEGASTFEGRVDVVRKIRNRPEILEFDRLVTEASVNVIREVKPRILISHLRAIDKLNGSSEAARHIDKNIGKILDACRGMEALAMLCGDHPPHSQLEQRSVPLVVGKV